jgi:cytoskeletal protein CcmA (bactofilin family)
MWKRDDVTKPDPDPASAPTGTAPAAAVRPQPSGPVSHAAADLRRTGEREAVNIGRSVVIKGELNGSEDVFIEGQVEGKVELRHHVLTVGPNGKLKAQVFARQVVVLGEVVGNITASEKVSIRDDGAVDGDLVSPRVAIAEGAHFRGSIDMQRKPPQGAPPPGVRPEAKASVQGPPARR